MLIGLFTGEFKLVFFNCANNLEMLLGVGSTEELGIEVLLNKVFEGADDDGVVGDVKALVAEL